MRRHRTDQEKKMTGRERLDLYKKIFFEARPIWKWLALSCLLCTVIIICSVLGPKITGELTNQICNYWEAKVSGGALWDLVREMLPGLLALLGVYTLGAGVRYGNMLLMNRMVSRHLYSMSLCKTMVDTRIPTTALTIR